MSTTLNLVSELERIARALDAEDADGTQVSLTAIAEKIAKIIGVRKEEAAILAVLLFSCDAPLSQRSCDSVSSP